MRDLHAGQQYVRKDRSDDYYLRIGRLATVGGIIVGIGTAFIASGFNNIVNYIQALFSLFNAPLFATFIVGMFWRRMSAWAGFWSLLLGTLSSLTLHLLYLADVVSFNSDLEESFWGAGLAFVTAVVVAIGVTMFTPAKPENDLRGLVYGLAGTSTSGETVLVGDKVWWRNPVLLGGIAVALAFLVTLRGIFDDQAEIDKAPGVRINLWMGISMLILGGLFLLWQWWRPTEVPATPDSRAEARPEASPEE